MEENAYSAKANSTLGVIFNTSLGQKGTTVGLNEQEMVCI